MKQSLTVARVRAGGLHALFRHVPIWRKSFSQRLFGGCSECRQIDHACNCDLAITIWAGCDFQLPCGRLPAQFGIDPGDHFPAIHAFAFHKITHSTSAQEVAPRIISKARRRCNGHFISQVPLVQWRSGRGLKSIDLRQDHSARNEACGKGPV